MNIYLEIFGYLGTALVLLSMMMTSVLKLRLFNILGSVISMTYAFLSGAWPVVFLNLGLIIINLWQLLRLQRSKTVFDCVELNADDRSLQYFLNYHDADLKLYFPDFVPVSGTDARVYMVFTAGEPVGVIMGKGEGDTLHVTLDYSTEKYRDCSVGAFLYGHLKAQGVRRLVCAEAGESHRQYLRKMGFEEQDGALCKTL